MIIAQAISANASQYERKSQRIDAAELAKAHDVRSTGKGADILHTYARRGIVTTSFDWRKLRRERRVLSPLKDAPTFVPEAVEDDWFAAQATRQQGNPATIATLVRANLREQIAQTLIRIHRFRDDVEWHLFDAAPRPDDLHNVDAWVDPAVDDDDYDGFVAEALVAGLPVVAARTPLNAQRLEQGRTGFLVRPRDPNELTHAILAALFKPELTEAKTTAARQTASKFRPRQRAKVLIQLYESII